MRIIIYDQFVRSVSGLTTFERNFIKAFCPFHQIIFMYKQADPQVLLGLMHKNVVFTQDNGQVVEGDICIFSSIQHGFPKPNIRAKKYIQMVHCDLSAWGIRYEKNPEIDLYIAVGKGVQSSLKKNMGIDSIVIPDLLDPIYDEKKVVRFLTASRLQIGKGIERIVQLAKQFKEAKMLFTWEVYGEGSMQYIHRVMEDARNVPEVQLMGKREDMIPYMRACDYVVQLSDNEGFCYAVYEALQIQKPVIITAWPHAEEIVQNGQNGYILNMDLRDVPIKEIFTNIPQHASLPEEAKIENVLLEWDALFSNLFPHIS